MADLSVRFRNVPPAPLLDAATGIAIEAGTGLHDTLYIARADKWSCLLVTADRRLEAKPRETRFAALIEVLDSR